MASGQTCSVEILQRQPTLGIRTRVPVERVPEFFDTAYGAVLGHLRSHGLEPAGPPYALTRNADMRDLDIEAGWPVPRALPGTGEVVSGEIAESRAASCVHVGSYDGLAASHDALKEWMAGQRLEGVGIAYEFYLDDPRETPPAERRTKISYPLRSDRSDER